MVFFLSLSTAIASKTAETQKKNDDDDLELIFTLSLPAPPLPPLSKRRGYNIGCRLVDDFLAKSRAPASACAGFRPAIDAVARGAFRAFLGVSPRVADWNEAGTAVSLLLDESPLTDWVELPRELAGLKYQNLLAGAVRGGLEQVWQIFFIFFPFFFFFFLLRGGGATTCEKTNL